MEHNRNFKIFLDKCAKKDKDAWDTFVEKYCYLIYQYILKTLKMYVHPFYDDKVDEIFNSVFLLLLEKNCKRLRNFRGENECSFIAYLRRICFNSTIDYLRKHRDFVDLEKIQYYISDKNIFSKLDHMDMNKIIFALRSELPDRYNHLFELIYEENLDSSEIAEILNLKLNAFYQLKFRMIKNIVKIAKKKNLYHELEAFMVDNSIKNHVCSLEPAV